MAGGRPPKPTEVKLREGNAGKRKLVDPVEVSKPVTDPAQLPFPSDYLPSAASILWNEIVGEIVADGVLRRADLMACVMMVQAAYDFVTASTNVEEHGYMVKDRHGQTKQNPWLAVRNEAARNYKSWCERFGLTPSDRTRLGMALVSGQEAALSLENILGGNRNGAATRNDIVDVDAVISPRKRGGVIATKPRPAPKPTAKKKPAPRKRTPAPKKDA